MTCFAAGAIVAEEGDVYWWEAWEDDAMEKKRKRAESPSLDAEDAVWQMGLHEMSVEVFRMLVVFLWLSLALLMYFACSMTVCVFIQELREEITQLQASVFSKSTTTSDIQIPVHRKQQRLRYF